MRKKIKILAIIILYISLIIINTKAYATTGITTEETTRVRKEASTSSSIVVLISQDEEVEVIEESGEWYKVKYNDGNTTYTGYIRQDLLKLSGKITEDTNSTENNTTTENTTSNNEENNTTSTNEGNQENNTTTSERDNENDTETEEIQENEKIKIKNKIEIKILPLITSSNIGTIEENTDITVKEIVGKWAYVEAKNKSGWVMSSKIERVEETNTEKDTKTSTNKTETENEEKAKNTETENDQKSNTTETTAETTMYVNVTTVNLREKADTNSAILDQLSINTKVTIVEKIDNTWSKVKVSGTTGYIATQYLSEGKTKEETTSRGSDETRTNATEKTQKSESSESSKSSESSESSDTTATKNSEKKDTSSSSSKITGEDVVAYAKNYLGYKYVSGGTSPETGFDCSGFTQYVYKHFGYSISRTSSTQRSDGTAVKKADLQAGDIVCFSGHVGVYIGGNQFIHAANSKKGVIITSLSDSYYVKNYITARRIL